MAIEFDRRRFLRLAGGAALATGLPGSVLGAPEPSGRLNVVFILVDDLGWADLACYGNGLHETPHVDRLARQGVWFTEAYAAAPVCSPTRASIMTGKHPARLHMTTWYESSGSPPRGRRLLPPVTQGNLPHGQVTIAEVLKKTGYLTAHVGKWHLGDAAHYPETQGFDVNVGGTFWGAPSTFFHPFSGFWSRSDEFRYVPGLGVGREGEYLTDRLTDEAILIVREAKDRPFFVNLCYHTVHTPIEGKARLVEHYRDKARSQGRQANCEYAAMVHSLDENVGRLLEAIDEAGIADRTVVIFFSDNGGYMNEYAGQAVTSNRPLRSGKGSLYEGGIRVPLIVRWPGVTEAGHVCDRMVCSCDFYPTLLDGLGLEGDPAHISDLDGRSLLPLLRDPDATLERDALYWHYPHYYPTTTPVSAIRHGPWKLLEYLEDERVELYNLADDLGEERDLAGTMAGRAEELRRRLHAWRQAVDAQMPAPNAAGRR